MQVKLEGMGELIDKLIKNEDLTPIKTVVQVHGAKLQGKAVRNAPVDTGTLRRSVTLEVAGDGLTAIVEPHTDYAAYVEYGTRKMRAQPYIRPSLSEVAPGFVADIQKLVK